jgi:hypothetical protein
MNPRRALSEDPGVINARPPKKRCVSNTGPFDENYVLAGGNDMVITDPDLTSPEEEIKALKNALSGRVMSAEAVVVSIVYASLQPY